LKDFYHDCDGNEQNDDVSKAPPLEPTGSVASDDPFSITPEEIQEVTTFSNEAAQKQQEGEQKGPIRLLCSEAFVDSFGEVIAEIVRGEGGSNNCDSSDTCHRPIRFTDTDLVDACAVDIELPSRSAMVVSILSQIRNDSGGILGAFLPRIVDLAATHRYNHLFIVVCVDVEVDSVISRDLVRLQTAFLPCGISQPQISVQWSSRRSLGACIGRTIGHFSTGRASGFPPSFSLSNVNLEWLSDPRTCQRLKFFLSIIPTLSVTGALHWLDLSIAKSKNQRKKLTNQRPTQHLTEEDEVDESMEWFQRCFRNVDDESSMLEFHLLRSKTHNANLWESMNPSVPKQLVQVVGARLHQT